MSLIVYGASDDLVEVDGDVREEFNPGVTPKRRRRCPVSDAAQDQRDPWTIACCPFCGDPARWSQRDRLSWCWQCPNPEHGYKYLDADQVEWVKVRRV